MWGWNEGTRGASEAQCSAARAQTQILVCASGHGTWSSDIPVSCYWLWETQLQD